MSFSYSSTSFDYSASSGEEYDAVMDEVPDSVQIINNTTRSASDSPELLEHPSPSWTVKTEYQDLDLLESEVAKLQSDLAYTNRHLNSRKISISSASDIDVESSDFEMVESESSDTASIIGSILSAWFLPALWTLAKIIDTVVIVKDTGASMMGWLYTSDA